MHDINVEYWKDYDGLQRAKHNILRRYIGGWFPILSSWSGRVLYIDCNAGRGKHETGEDGSPIIALKCLLNHNLRNMILSKSEVSFLFFENNEINANVLQSEINQLGQLPEKISCSLMCDDYQKQLSDRLDTLEKTGGKLSPTFAFIDPYGYSISMELLNRLLSFKHCELFINFMYRYVDMAMHDKTKAGNMNELFGTYLWQELLDIEDPDERLLKTIRLFSDQLHAGYVTSTVMRGERNQVKYVLIHASNALKARDTMKEAIWSVIPDGSFTAYERDNPGQLVLISPDPDLRTLESIIWKNFRGKSVRMDEIYEVVDSTLYLRKHIHKIIKNYLDKNRVTATGYTGRFAFSNNPVIEFPAELF